MDAKLTLKLSKEVIEKAKEYANGKGLSLSRMIENYLRAITTKQQEDLLEENLSDYVKSIPQKMDLPEDYDEKADYKSHRFNKEKGEQ